MKAKIIQIFALPLCLPVFYNAHAQTILNNGPRVQWKSVTWPDKDVNGNSQTQASSGENWWYGHCNAYDSNHKLLGYVAVGYTDIVRDANFQSTTPITGDCMTLQPITTSKLDVSTFETPNHYKGASVQIAGFFTKDGKMLWCKTYNYGVFFNALQASDGSVVIAGIQDNTMRDRITGVQVPYNPTTAQAPNNFTYFQDNFSCNSANYKEGFDRKMSVTKIDPLIGDVDWNYVYAYKDYNSPFGQDAYNCAAMAWDITETNNSYMVVGSSFISGSKTITEAGELKAMLLCLDNNGYVNWKKLITNTNPGDTMISEAFAVAYNPAVNKVIVSVKRHIHTNIPYQVQTGADLWEFTYSGTTTPAFNPSNLIHSFDYYPNTADFATDLCFDIYGNILFPHLARIPNLNRNCKGWVAKFSPSGTLIYNKPIPNVVAYDDKIGILPLFGGGYAIVTSVRQVPPPTFTSLPAAIQTSLNNIAAADSYPSYFHNTNDFDYWNSDAYVARFDASGNKLWDRTFDETNAASQPFPGNIKNEECLYHITQSDDGGFVISGNTSDNFDDCYLVKLGSGCDALAAAYNIFTIPNGATITANTTWNNGKNIRGLIEVKPGATLTINGATIRFADSRRSNVRTYLQVDQGGILKLINGATLTNFAIACDLANNSKGMWDGVQVLGSPNDPPGATQGKIIMDNATIENARIGLLMGKRYYDPYTNVANPLYGFGGGIVQCSKSLFKNCAFDVKFYPYIYSRNHTGNQSAFSKTQFICDAPLVSAEYTQSIIDANNNLSYLPLGTKEFVGLYDVHDVTFYGTTIENDGNFPYGYRGTGIGSFDASYTVKRTCDAINMSTGQCTGQRPVFNNLDYGINAAAENPVYSLNVNGATFNNNDKGGIYLKGIDYAKINQSTFNIAPNMMINPPDYGVYLYACNNYQIEDNTFQPYGSYLGQQTGIYDYYPADPMNPNNAQNKIYHNTVHQMYVGIGSLGDNRGSMPTKGLQILCNNVRNQTDIYSSFFATSGTCGIAPFQGSSTHAAGNLFAPVCSSSIGQLFNKETNPFSESHYTYYYNQNTPGYQTQPLCYYSAYSIQLIGISSFFDTQTCPDNFNTVYVGNVFLNMQQQIHNAQQQAASWQAQYNQAIDGGNMNNLLSYITGNHSNGQIKNALMNASPYLSDTVLLTSLAINLPPGHIKQVMVANSPLTAKVMTGVQNAGLPNGIKQQIENAQTGISERQKLEDNVSYTAAQLKLEENALVREFIHADTIAGHLDSAYKYMKIYDNRPQKACRKLAFAMAMNDTLGAAHLIDSMKIAQGSLNIFCQVQQAMLTLQQTDGDCRAMAKNDSMLAAIQGLAADTTQRGCIAARSLLAFVTHTSIPEVFLLPQANHQRRSNPNGNPPPADSSNTIPVADGTIKIFPNPVHNSVTVLFDIKNGVQEGQIILQDLSGKTIQKIPLSKGESRLQINLQHYPAGLYIYHIWVNKGIQRTGKLIRLP